VNRGSELSFVAMTDELRRFMDYCLGYLSISLW
jgi:hypothetical protein